MPPSTSGRFINGKSAFIKIIFRCISALPHPVSTPGSYDDRRGRGRGVTTPPLIILVFIYFQYLYWRCLAQICTDLHHILLSKVFSPPSSSDISSFSIPSHSDLSFEKHKKVKVRQYETPSSMMCNSQKYAPNIIFWIGRKRHNLSN